MAKRDIRNIKEDYFICAICMDHYTDPRTLPCDHTFCRKCLSSHISESRTKMSAIYFREIKCPSCRGPVKLQEPNLSDDTIAASFPPNNLLKDIDERIQLHESGFPPCKHHTEKPGEYFCSTDNVVLCADCGVSKHRAVTCNVIHVKDAGVKLKPEWEQLTKTYDVKIEELKLMLKQEYKNNLKKDIKSKTLIDMEEFEKQLCLFFDKALKSIERVKKRLGSREMLLDGGFNLKIHNMIADLEKTKKQLEDVTKGTTWLLKLQDYKKERESCFANMDEDIKQFSKSVFIANKEIRTVLFNSFVSVGFLGFHELQRES